MAIPLEGVSLVITGAGIRARLPRTMVNAAYSNKQIGTIRFFLVHSLVVDGVLRPTDSWLWLIFELQDHNFLRFFLFGLRFDLF